MIYHNMPREDVLKTLGTDEENGLSAEQIEAKRAEFGENKFSEKKRKSLPRRFLEQFKDVMILILIAAAGVSFAMAFTEDDPKAFFEPALILAIVVLNAILGLMQENKAEKALDALKSMSAPKARVIRSGEEELIEASRLVPGDIIKLEAGDFVPADARLIRSAGLKCEEAVLTGESLPSEKNAEDTVDENAPLGDRSNMLFSGCSVTYGTAEAVVTATGMNTEMGKIAGLLESEEQGRTPLQKKLADLGKKLGIMALAACAVIFVIGLINGIPVMEIFITSVSLAVSAIPEGLPAIVTIVLSIGVQRMAKKNAVVRSLPAVETLGSASVICSDKTGTLTQNRMTLVKAWVSGAEMPEDISDENSNDVKRLLEFALLCCDGSVSFTEDGEKHIGDPTETSIIVAAHKNGMEKDEINSRFPRVAELPFDSDRKLMTSVNKVGDKLIVTVKGAFDIMLSRCTGGELAAAEAVNDSMSRDALRVLAIACKQIESLPEDMSPDKLESDLKLLGLVGMIDPPRAEAKEAVSVCRGAGIKPVMITGDHVITASAIARELGIMSEGDRAVTGAELDKMSEAELEEQAPQISVYARVSPENKIRIVKAWQKRGEVVSMTGDGVNDAPALKAADIGCAMGITGTDVAKGAADMTLSDDNFATIVDAVKEGRGIYDNIKKVVGFLLGTNIGEVIAVFACMLLWHVSPLLSMQLLWINLVTDSLPAVALGVEAVESDVMTRKPKPKSEGIFAHGFGVRIVLQGVMFGALALAAFKIGDSVTGNITGGRTMAFMVLALSQILQAFNMRSERSLFKIGVFKNKKLNMSALLSALLVAAVLFTPARIAFGLIILPAKLYLIALGLIFVPLAVMEISKAVGFIKHHG